MLLLMNRRFAAGFAGLLTILLAACSSGASSTPSASTAAVVSPSASEAAPPVETSASASASEMASASGGVPGLPGDFHGAPDLEALLPRQLGGQQLQVVSFTGDTFMNMGNTGDQSFKDFLDRLGAEPKDISVAIAAAAGDTSSSVTVFRARGTDQSQLENEFESVIQEDASGKLTWRDETIGGKSVKTTTKPEEGNLYMYAKGDTIFVVMTTDASVAEEALSQLP
jgi:hypothetical protein